MIPRPSPAATRSSPVASAILALCAVGAMGAAVTAVPRVAAADPAVQGAELWRLVGYLTFAGLFLILARNPDQPALWAVTIASKAALPLAALTVIRAADEASTFLAVDGIVTVLLVTAYLLARRARVGAPAVAAAREEVPA